MRPSVQEIAEWFAFAFHARRKVSFACRNKDGSAKLCYRTRRRANKARLKYQHAYRCYTHGWHLTSQPKQPTRQ